VLQVGARVLARRGCGVGALALLALLVACGGPGSAAEGTAGTGSSAEDASTSLDATGVEGQEACELEPCETGDIGLRNCKFVFQDCPGGYKCVPYWPPGTADLWQQPEYKCVPVSGTHEPGESCTLDGLDTAHDDCDADGFCWTYASTEIEGRCHPFCTGGFQYAECIEGWNCVLNEIWPPMCVRRCLPLADDCGPDSLCLWGDTAFGCAPAGEGLAAGEPCALVNDCAAGSLCLEAAALSGCEGERCCASYCSLAAGDGPCQAIDPGYACVAMFEKPPPDAEDVGVCIVP
jgi:hypothetical protein